MNWRIPNITDFRKLFREPRYPFKGLDTKRSYWTADDNDAYPGNPIHIMLPSMAVRGGNSRHFACNLWLCRDVEGCESGPERYYELNTGLVIDLDNSTEWFIDAGLFGAVSLERAKDIIRGLINT